MLCIYIYVKRERERESQRDGEREMRQCTRDYDSMAAHGLELSVRPWPPQGWQVFSRPPQGGRSRHSTPSHREALEHSRAMPPPARSRCLGDANAQRLSFLLTTLNWQLGGRFFNEARRSWVLTLPTESGEKVVEAFKFSATRRSLQASLRQAPLRRPRWTPGCASCASRGGQALIIVHHPHISPGSHPHLSQGACMCHSLVAA